MNEPEIAEIVDETKELFDRVMDNIREDFLSYIEQSRMSPKNDLIYYASLSEKEKTFNIAAAVMARTADMYHVNLIPWIEELLKHETGREHKIQLFVEAPGE